MPDMVLVNYLESTWIMLHGALDSSTTVHTKIKSNYGRRACSYRSKITVSLLLNDTMCGMCAEDGETVNSKHQCGYCVLH